MDVSAVAALAAAAGGGVGLLAGALAVRGRRDRRPLNGSGRPTAETASRPSAGDDGLVPPGVLDVLNVLSSSAVLVDSSDRIVISVTGAHALAVAGQDRLTSEELRQLVREVRRDGRTRQVELELPRGPFGGETLPVSARVAALTGDLVLVLMDDRTEMRRVDAVRRDFVANVSHELKTPVGALILLAEAVIGASDDPDAVRRFAQRMQYEASRLSFLVQEVIDLSRLQGHDPLREAEVVDVDGVIAEAVETVRLAATAKAISLVTGGQRDLTVLGDRTQLVTAVRNLVDNAVSYSSEHTRVAVAVRRAGEVVEIAVTDQGLGIPERDLERIFERFYRVDPARSRGTGGTGLGLSIVKHIATNHGGEVHVWSVEGSGSTFTIRLPVRTTAGSSSLASIAGSTARTAAREAAS